MVTDDDLLGYVTEIMEKLNPEKDLHVKIADCLLRLQGLLRQSKQGPSIATMGPKRDRAAYMRDYRARKKGPSSRIDGTQRIV